MNSDFIISFMLVSLIFIFVILFFNPFKFLTKLCIRSLTMTGLIFVINHFSPVILGINPFTALYCGFFGIWGVIGLYIIKFFT